MSPETTEQLDTMRKVVKASARLVSEIETAQENDEDPPHEALEDLKLTLDHCESACPHLFGDSAA